MHCRVQFVFSWVQTDQMTQNVSNSMVSVEIKLNVKMSSWYELDMVWPWPKLTPHPHAKATYLCCRNAGDASCTFVSDSSRYFLTNSWIPFFPGSIYSTLAVAIERYVSVCHPHFTPPHCTGNLSVAALLIFSFLFNSLRFVEFRTVYDYRVSEWIDL